MKRSNITLNIAIVIMLLFTALVGIGSALVPPPPPPPPVPQNIGLPDTSIVTLITTATDQSACRICHQTSGTNISSVTNNSNSYNNTVGGVPTRHHSLLARNVINPNTSVPFACQDCHPSTPGVGMGILLDRSCLDCHNGTNKFPGNAIGGHVGNISRPHHVNTSYASSNIGNPAANRTCNFCHGSVVDNYNDGHYVPSYATDFTITPYATFKVTNFSQPANAEIPPDGDDNKTWGGCYSCHEDVPNALPQPIGSNADNHHNSIRTAPTAPFDLTGGSPFNNRTCFICHVVTWTASSSSPFRFNVTNPFTGELLVRAMELRNSTIEATSALESGTTNVTINGTGCEKCHSVKSLHNIQFNYISGGNGPQGLGHINNNVDCFGCHNSWLPAGSATVGAIIPTVNTVSPSTIVVGTPTTLTFTGINFVNDAYTSVVTVDGVSYIPTSITDTQIVVDIPALSAGVYTTKLVKGGDTFSNLETLTVVPVVTLSSATLDGVTLTLSGTGLGSQPATNAAQNVIAGSAGYSANIVSWTDTKVVATVSSVVKAGDTAQVITANGGEAAVSVLPGLSPLKDTIPPVITVNGVSPVTIALNSVYTDAGATAVDNVDGSVPVVTTGSVNTKVVGTYTLAYTATDKSNNTATAKRTVNVAKPVLTTVTVTPSSATVSKKGKQTFTATAKDQFGSVMPKVSITWSSSVKNVGTVSSSSATTGTNGQATTIFTASAGKTGKTIVSAKSGAVSGTATVTVK